VLAYPDVLEMHVCQFRPNDFYTQFASLTAPDALQN
jgi:hypothetical protein